MNAPTFGNSLTSGCSGSKFGYGNLPWAFSRGTAAAQTELTCAMKVGFGAVAEDGVAIDAVGWPAGALAVPLLLLLELPHAANPTAARIATAGPACRMPIAAPVRWRGPCLTREKLIKRAGQVNGEAAASPRRALADRFRRGSGACRGCPSA